jgi:hypothetical protein
MIILYGLYDNKYKLNKYKKFLFSHDNNIVNTLVSQIINTNNHNLYYKKNEVYDKYSINRFIDKIINLISNTDFKDIYYNKVQVDKLIGNITSQVSNIDNNLNNINNNYVPERIMITNIMGELITSTWSSYKLDEFNDNTILHRSHLLFNFAEHGFINYNNLYYSKNEVYNKKQINEFINSNIHLLNIISSNSLAAIKSNQYVFSQNYKKHNQNIINFIN